MRRERDANAALAVQLGTAVDAALAAAAPGGDHAGRRWTAARAVVAAAARARLQQQGRPVGGALFAACDDAGLASPWAGPAPTFAELGACYPALLSPADRKRGGAWFTAPELARPTTARTLGPLADASALRIGDPAVGAGAFLLAALRERVAAGRDPAAVAAEELFGLDLDPTAAQLAALALHEACGDAAPPLAAIERNVRAGDGLLEWDDGAFDAVLGNPPWETLQAPRPGRDPAAAARLAARIAALRRAFADQGRGKLYTYRLFVERALRLLRPGGRLGLVVPASLYFDRDAAPLRRRLLDECRWEWLFSFENRRRLFAIDGRYRFGPIVAEKGGRTDAVRTAFLRCDPADWAAPAPTCLVYRRADLALLSPGSGAFVAVSDERDLDLLRRMTARGAPLLGDRGACRWRQGDLNMTGDLHRFVPRAQAERDGYRPSDDGTWRRDGGRDALRPLYQGAMIADLHPNAGAFAGGAGRGVRWRAPACELRLEPQYLVRPDTAPVAAPARVALRALSNATNERTAVACLLAEEPCGNSLGALTPRDDAGAPIGAAAFVAGVLGSLVWDWALRQRLCGTNVNGFVLADTVLPRCDDGARFAIAALALQLSAVLPWHGGLWAQARAEGWVPAVARPVTDAAARRRLLADLDAAVAEAFGLGADDLGWMLRACDLAPALLQRREVVRRLDPRGFWRVDRTLEPAARRPALAMAAFAAPAAPPAHGIAD
ncbi:MAG: N-6 DNA methylase [Planctomycetota bacterium]